MEIKNKPQFYTLLYVDDRFKSISHNMTGTFEQQIITFLRCCQTLDSSLRFFANSGLIVLTNNESFVRAHATDLQVKEISFNLDLPEGIGFFASHQKLEVYKYFAQLPDKEYMILLDNDIVCINQMPLNLINCINMNIPVYYDITRQAYPGAGRDVIIRDKQFLMNGTSSTGTWAGGEFIGGDNMFFRSLREEVEKILKQYLDNLQRFHHQGDELIVSVGLEHFMKKQHVQNVGLFGGIGRYWGCKTLHVQEDINAFADHFLLHLPADKEYLAVVRHAGEDFLRQYKRYLWNKRISPVSTIKGLVGRIKKHILHGSR